MAHTHRKTYAPPSAGGTPHSADSDNAIRTHTPVSSDCARLLYHEQHIADSAFSPSCCHRRERVENDESRAFTSASQVAGRPATESPHHGSAGGWVGLLVGVMTMLEHTSEAKANRTSCMICTYIGRPRGAAASGGGAVMVPLGLPDRERV